VVMSLGKFLESLALPAGERVKSFRILGSSCAKFAWLKSFSKLEARADLIHPQRPPSCGLDAQNEKPSQRSIFQQFRAVWWSSWSELVFWLTSP
jgi:hypothetical protein